MAYFIRLSIIFILFPVTLWALGKEVSVSDHLVEIPSEVEFITSCGHWNQMNQKGFYRVISGEATAQSFLHVQWIRINQNNGKRTVERSLSFPEINNDHAEISLSDIKCQSKEKGGILLKANAESVGHHISKRQIEIQINNEFGKYEFPKKWYE